MKSQMKIDKYAACSPKIYSPLSDNIYIFSTFAPQIQD